MSAPRAVLLAPAMLVLVACTAAGTPAAAPLTSSVVVPSAAVAAAPAPLAGRTVVLDPGHNGRNGRTETTTQVPDGRGGTKACNTTGTATDAGYREHAFTWDVVQRIRAQLETAGARVVLTRDSDDGTGPCVDVRGRAGQAAGADLTVSVHADGSAPGNRGFHVAYSAPPLNAVQAGPALDLARDLRDAMVAGKFAVSDYIGTDGLSPRPDLAGLNLATVPTVLVECANMRNPGEAALVSSPAGRERYATAITDGIRRYLAR